MSTPDLQTRADAIQRRADRALSSPSALFIPADLRQLIRDLVGLVADLTKGKTDGT